MADPGPTGSDMQADADADADVDAGTVGRCWLRHDLLFDADGGNEEGTGTLTHGSAQ